MLWPRFNSVAKFSPAKLNQTEFFTNKGINPYLITEGALDFSPTSVSPGDFAHSMLFCAPAPAPENEGK